MTAPDLKIRWLIRRDLPEVLAIENAAFEYPWTEDDFIRCLRQRNCIGLVVDAGDRDESKLLGTMVYELEKTRLRLLTIAVHPQHQRCGIGRLMIDKLKCKLSLQRRRTIIVDVWDSNLDAHLFFRDQGFRASAVVKGVYQTPDDCDADAYEFRYRLPAAALFDNDACQPSHVERFS